ncbi:NUDIX hydrolase [Ferrimonas pelagia]|uniref:NUDIX hydrolase n=1 Tax=Ferrimonas pelagia TaxID=1177826 RepID=A0ABP9F649_9GAMM
MRTHRPRVGIGIILRRHDGKILLGQRRGSHAPYWSIPGGHLELGETFEQCAIREMAEETGLQIEAPQVIAVTNNLETYQQEGVHSISVCLLAHHNGAQPSNLEPDKCAGWHWFDPHSPLPQPHFDASRQSIECYLSQQFYRPLDT